MIAISLIVMGAFLLVVLLPGYIYMKTENLKKSQFVFGCGIIFFIVLFVIISGTVPYAKP